MENTTDIEEKTEMALAQADEKPQETYHVLEFVEKHTSAFIAILSGMVAVAAFVLNLVAYVYQRIRLNPWHIGGEVIDYWGSGQVYVALIVDVAYFVLICALSVALACSFVNYYRARAAWQYTQGQSKLMSETVHKMQSEMKVYVAECAKDDATEKELLTTTVSGVNARLKDMNKRLARARRNMLLRIGLISLLIVLLAVPVIFLMLGTTGEVEPRIGVLTWGITALSIVLSAMTQAKQLDNTCAPRTVCSNIKSITQNSDIAFKELDKKGDEAVRKRKQSTVRLALSDRAVKENVGRALLSTLLMISIFLMTAGGSAYQQKEFWIYSDAINTYAVAYQDSNHCVLKQATLNGDEIIIHTGEQLVVSGTVATSQRTFNKVTFEDVTTPK